MASGITNDYFEVDTFQAGDFAPSIGYAKWLLSGTQASTAGPNFMAKTDEDDYPCISSSLWEHDSVAIGIDSYFDGTDWRSSSATSNFVIKKDSLSLSIYSNLGTAQGSTFSIVNPAFQMYSSLDIGNSRMRKQSAFRAAGTFTLVSNVTGDGTAYTVIFDLPKINQGANYSPITGIYTAPIGANMIFSSCVEVIGTSADTKLVLVTTSGNIDLVYVDTTLLDVAGTGRWCLGGSGSLPLDSGDTAKIVLTMSGGAKTADLDRGDGTTFCGAIVS